MGIKNDIKIIRCCTNTSRSSTNRFEYPTSREWTTYYTNRGDRSIVTDTMILIHVNSSSCLRSHKAEAPVSILEHKWKHIEPFRELNMEVINRKCHGAKFYTTNWKIDVGNRMKVILKTDITDRNLIFRSWKYNKNWCWNESICSISFLSWPNRQ